MNANKPASRRSLKSDLARVDAHVVKKGEYEELPELTQEMLARATVNRGGRPLSANPRKLLSIRLPADVIERWKATGPGWQTRMADVLASARMSRGDAVRAKLAARELKDSDVSDAVRAVRVKAASRGVSEPQPAYAATPHSSQRKAAKKKAGKR
jgi:uncharacterized protein (DUF4415 family)